MADQFVTELALRASLDMRDANRSIGGLAALFDKRFKEASEAAFTVRELRGLDKARDKYAREMTKANFQWQEAARKLEIDRADVVSAAQKNAAETEMKNIQARAAAEMKALDPVIARRMQAAKKYKEFFGEDLDRSSIFKLENAEKFGDTIGEAFSEATSKDLKSMAGLLKKLGKFTGTQGAKLEAGAGGGAMGGAMGGLGKALGGLGKVVMVIGGIAAGIAALVKVLFDADAQTKDLNRSLLDAGVSGADLVDKYGDITGVLNNTRRAFTEALRFNLKWGVTAKENLEILGNFAEAGVVFQEITAGTRTAEEQMGRLRDTTQAALVYSKLLGKTANEIAVDMGTLMTDFGYTLGGVQERLSSIISLGKESGFATKRFYGMVLQATSGMSMYNVRLEEAAELLMSLGKILGENLAGDYLQGLVRGFKDESTQDRIKKTMTTGVSYSLKVLQKGAVNAAAEFQRQLREFGTENKEQADRFMDAMAGAFKVSRDQVSKMSPEALARALAKLPKGLHDALLAQASASNEELARQITALSGKSMAFRGGRGGAQAAREFASPAEALLLQLNELRTVLKKRVDQIDLTNETERMAWENLTGIQGEAARKQFEIGRRYSGINTMLSKRQAEIKKVSGTGEALRLMNDFNDQYGKAFGFVVDEMGNRFKAVTDSMGNVTKGAKIGDSFDDLLLSLGDLSGAITGGVPEDIRLATEIAENTRDLGHIMEIGVQALLEQINKAVQWIASTLGLGSEDEKKARAAALDVISKEREKVGGDIGTARERRRVLAGELKGQMTGGERKQKEGEMAALDANIATLEEKQKRLREQQSAVRGVEGHTTVEGVLIEARRSTTQEALARMTPEQQKEARARAKEKSLAAAKEEAVRMHARQQADPFFRLGQGVTGQTSEEALAEVEEYLDGVYASSEVQERFLALELAASEKLITTEEAIYDKEKKEEDARQKKILTAQEKQAQEDLAVMLMGAGLASNSENAMGVAGQIQAGRPPEALKGDLAQLLKSNPDAAKLFGLEGMSRFQGAIPSGQDIVLQIGEGGVKFAHRVDAGDVGVFAKPGGALSQVGGGGGARGGGGGGGGTVNVFHLYNDGAGVMKSIEKAQRAGVLR